MKDIIRKHIIFYGSVQGVGFRYYSVNKARQLGLTGWVRNLYYCTVEMEVQGEEQAIDKLIMFLDRQRYIRIEKMDVKSQTLQDEYGFYEQD